MKLKLWQQALIALYMTACIGVGAVVGGAVLLAVTPRAGIAQTPDTTPTAKSWLVGLTTQPINPPALLDSAWAYDVACAPLDSAQRARVEAVGPYGILWFSVTTPDGQLPTDPSGNVSWYAYITKSLQRVYIVTKYTQSEVVVAHELMHRVYVVATGDTSFDAHPDRYFRYCRLEIDQYVFPLIGRINREVDNDRRLLETRFPGRRP